jgi:hypothetical protein
LTGVTVTTGARRVVSALVSFFPESTTQLARRSGRRKAEIAKREAGRRNRMELGIGVGGGTEREGVSGVVWKLKSYAAFKQMAPCSVLMDLVGEPINSPRRH